jgi:PAS domain S-box-containing protein
MVLTELLKGLAGAQDPLVIVGQSGSILFANQQLGDLLGYPPRELLGLTIELLMPERFRMQHISHRLCFTDEGRTRPMGAARGLFVLCKDGSERPVDISLTPIRRGLETVVVAVIHDATEPM